MRAPKMSYAAGASETVALRCCFFAGAFLPLPALADAARLPFAGALPCALPCAAPQAVQGHV